MSHSIAQLQKHETLFGGVANHGDVLQPVYCMLLALHTAGQSIHVRSKLPSVLGSIQTAAAGLSDVASQPVIAALLKITLAVWSAPEAYDSSEVCESPLSLVSRALVAECKTVACAFSRSSLYMRTAAGTSCCCISYRASDTTVTVTVGTAPLLGGYPAMLVMKSC